MFLMFALLGALAFRCVRALLLRCVAGAAAVCPRAPWAAGRLVNGPRRPGSVGPLCSSARVLSFFPWPVVRLRVFRYSGHSGGLPCSRGKTQSPHGSAINGFLGRGNHPGYGILGTRVDERVHGVVTFGGGLPLCPEWRIPRSRATFFSIPLLAGTLRGGGGLGSRCRPLVVCPMLCVRRPKTNKNLNSILPLFSLLFFAKC